MADTNTPAGDSAPPTFPYITVAVAVCILFVFLGLMWLATRKENPLEPPPAADAKAEPMVDAAAKLDEVKARNQAALDGVGAKMSLRDAHGVLLGKLKSPNDKLPFPTPEPPVAPAPPPKDEKKDGKGAPVPELKKAED
jgi:hypothetical protein